MCKACLANSASTQADSFIGFIREVIKTLQSRVYKLLYRKAGNASKHVHSLIDFKVEQ